MKKSSLMVIAAHCDDNESSFGGTMLKYHKQFGYDVVYVQSTNNMSGSWFECTQGPSAGLAPFPAWIDEKETYKETHVSSDTYFLNTIPWYHILSQRKRELVGSIFL